MTFLRGFSVNALSTLVVFLAGLGNQALITRAVGVDGRGQYAVLAKIVLLLAVVFGEGLRKANAYLVGRNRTAAPSVFFGSVFYTVLLGALIFAVYLPGRDRIPGLIPNMPTAPLILILCVGTLQVGYRCILGVFLGLDRMVEYALLLALLIVLYLGANVYAVHILHAGLLGITICWLLSTMLTLAAAAVLLGRLVPLTSSLDIRLLEGLKNVGPRATGSNVFVFLMLSVDIFLVYYLFGERATGIYSISVLFLDLMSRLPNVAGAVLFPKVVSSEDAAYREELTCRVSRAVLLFGLAVSLSLVAVGRPLIVFLFGTEYEPSYGLLLWMLPGAVAVACGSIVNTHLCARGYPAVTIFAPAIAMEIKVVMTFFLIPTMGLAGPAISASLTYVLWAGMVFGHFSRTRGRPWRELILPRMRDFADLREQRAAAAGPSEGIGV